VESSNLTRERSTEFERKYERLQSCIAIAAFDAGSWCATVYYLMAGHEDMIAIPVGAFAAPTFPAPMFSVYEERMHSLGGHAARH
jgi:hypothetical protein